jgi:hypothetical protein
MKPDPLGIPRDPYRIFLLSWLAINGLLQACGIPTSSSLDRQLDSHFERLYGGLLGVSALLVLFGMFWPWDPRDGLIGKVAGFIGLTFGIGIYALATLFTNNAGGSFVGVAGLCFAAVCAHSAWRAFSRLLDGAHAQHDETETD